MSKNKITVEELELRMNPESGRLFRIGETWMYQIVDVELDPVNCSFHYDGCVEINTESYSYITLTKQNLKTLIKMIDETERRYKEEFEKEKDNGPT